MWRTYKPELLVHINFFSLRYSILTKFVQGRFKSARLCKSCVVGSCPPKLNFSLKRKVVVKCRLLRNGKICSSKLATSSRYLYEPKSSSMSHLLIHNLRLLSFAGLFERESVLQGFSRCGACVGSKDCNSRFRFAHIKCHTAQMGLLRAHFRSRCTSCGRKQIQTSWRKFQRHNVCDF